MNCLFICLILTGFALVANAQEDPSVYCYECNELENPACKDPFPKGKELLKRCEPNQKYCRKTVQNINGKDSIVRQCASEKFKDGIEGCYKTAGKATQHVCTCIPKAGDNEGSCNTGSYAKSSFLLLVISTIILKFLF